MEYGSPEVLAPGAGNTPHPESHHGVTALIGYTGTLAEAVAGRLHLRHIEAVVLPATAPLARLKKLRPARLICFPFPVCQTRAAAARVNEDLSRLDEILEWATADHVNRIVLRSHAIAYGSSVKNPGLMSEDRVSLLPKLSRERRWVQAEQRLFRWAKRQYAPFSAAAIRLATVLSDEEGDFLVHMLRGKSSAPLAGHDPAVQFLALEDAAEALVRALLSDAAGIFNIAGEGVVHFRSALRSAVPRRFALPGKVQKAAREILWKAGAAAHPGESVEQIRYNWTVTSERAGKELEFRPRYDTASALRRFLQEKGGMRVPLKDVYDPYGLDPEYLQRLDAWFLFLRRYYWRVEHEGIENIPETGAALLTSNHRGFMPFDGVVHRSLILERRHRHIRFLVIPSLFKFPFLSDFLIKQGGVVASQENGVRLLNQGELVGIFPEGIGGAFRMYRGAYRLGEMGRDAFARMALASGAPIYPALTIGHVEIFPILARWNSSLLTRITGWPFLPITPTFPLFPLPLPTKWHIRYLEPVPMQGPSPADAANPARVRELSDHVRDLMQRNIDEMLSRRKHIFFGNIFQARAEKKDRAATEHP